MVKDPHSKASEPDCLSLFACDYDAASLQGGAGWIIVKGYRVAVVKGKMAMFRALLTATVICLWCFAQFPEILRGMIFPRSVTKKRRILGFL